jgi:hypothetical protein
MMFAGISPYEDFLMNSWLWLLLGILYRLRMFSKTARIAQDQAVLGET